MSNSSYKKKLDAWEKWYKAREEAASVLDIELQKIGTDLWTFLHNFSKASGVVTHDELSKNVTLRNALIKFDTLTEEGKSITYPRTKAEIEEDRADEKWEAEQERQERRLRAEEDDDGSEDNPTVSPVSVILVSVIALMALRALRG